MAIIVKDKKYYNDFTGDTTDTLVGNVGDKIICELIIAAKIEFLSSDGNKLQVNNGNVLSRAQGSFIADGFGVGKTYTFTGFYFDGSSVISQNVTFTPISVTSNQMEILNTAGVNPNIQNGFYPTQQPASGDPFYSTALIEASGNQFEGMEFNYNLIQNSLITSGSINSIIDGTPQTYRIPVLPAVGAPYVNAIKLFKKSGDHQIETKVRRYSNDADGNRVYEIRHEFRIHGLFEDASDLVEGSIEQPEWFEFQEALTDWVGVKLFPDYNNKNIGAELKSSQYAALGNTGYLGENFDGLPNQFELVANSVTFTAPDGTVLSGINFNDTTNISFKVLHPFADAAEKFKLSFFYIPDSDDEYKNILDYRYYDNLIAAFRDSNVGFNTGTVAGNTNQSGAQMTFGSVNVTSITGGYRFDTSITPNSAFATYMKNRQEGARKYLLTVDLTDVTVAYNFSPLVKLPVSIAQMDDYVVPAGEYDIQNQFYEHPFGNGGAQSLPLKCAVEDIIRSRFIVRVENSVEVLNSLMFDLEGVNSVTNQSFSFDSYNINFEDQSIYPVISGVQQLAFNSTRNYKLAAGSEENLVKVERYPAGDTSTKVAYRVDLAYTIRWEDYIANNNVPNDFFDNTLLNDGRNMDMAPKDNIANWDLGISVYTRVNDSVQGNLLYKNFYNFESVEDYEFNSDAWQNDVIHQDSSGTVLAIDSSTNAILDNGFTKVIGEHKNLTGAVSYLDYVGELRLEKYQQGSLLGIQRLSTFRPYDPNNALVPLDGLSLAKISNSASDTLIIEGRIDPSILEGGFEWKTSSRIWCKEKPEETPTEVNKEPFTTEFSAQF